MLRLAGLPAGETLLEVRATDAYGRWSNPVKALVLVCPDSRYGCLGWGILTAVLLAAGGYLWARSRRKRVEEQEAMQVRKSENNVQNSPKETDGNIEPETEPSAGLSVTDREFLDKASASVFSHLSDTGYSVENISSFETGRNDNARILLWYFEHGMKSDYLFERGLNNGKDI